MKTASRKPVTAVAAQRLNEGLEAAKKQLADVEKDIVTEAKKQRKSIEKVLLFPSRQGGVKAAATATTPMDPGGVQTTLHKVVQTCGLKKRSRPTACATAMPPI